MTSEIRANTLKNRVGLGTIEYSNTGPVISGVTTAFNFKTGTSNLHSTGLNIFDLDVDGHTNLDNVSVAGVTTFASNVFLGDDDNLYLGASNDLRIYHATGAASHINAVGLVNIDGTTGVRLEYNNSNRVHCTSTGVTIGGDLDVDAHTNLDNVSIAGITTITKGLVMTAGASNLYQINGALSYYAADNAVYLNGAGDSGVLRLNATGTYNDRTSINIHGKDVSNYQDAITFKTVSQERLRITSDGDVIIGSGGAWSYPKALNVQGSSGSILSLYNADTTTYAADTTTGIEFKLLTGNTGTTSGSCEIRAFKENGNNGDSARALSFYTGVNGGSPTERLRIHSDGKIGIGLAGGTPDGLLEVYNSSTSGNTVLKVHNDKNGDAANLTLEGKRTSDNDTAQVLFKNNNYSVAGIFANAGGSGNHDGGYLKFFTSEVGSGNAVTEKLRIASDGVATFSTTNINVNRNAGDAYIALQTSGTSNVSLYGGASSGFRVFTKPSGGSLYERARIDPDGFLGIGNLNSGTVPHEYIHVAQTEASTNQYNGGRIKIGGNGNTALGFTLGYNGIGSGRACITQLNNNGGANSRITLGFGSIDSSGKPSNHVMTLNQSRNVGIKKEEPTAVLHLANADEQIDNSAVKHLRFPLYHASGTHTILTLGGSFDSGFVCFAVLEYIGLYSYAGTAMSGGVRRAYTRRTVNNTQWRDFDNQVSENYGENYRPDLFWENGVLKMTVGGSVQITGYITITGHGNNVSNVQFTRGSGL